MTYNSPYSESLKGLAGVLAENAIPTLLLTAFLEAVDDKNNPARVFKSKPSRSVEFDAVVLMSGGVDSTILYHRAIKRHGFKSVLPLYLDFGQQYANAEQVALRRMQIRYSYMSAKVSIPQGWNHIIPARNLIALDIAGSLCNPKGTVYFGVTDGESPFTGGDKSLKFLGLAGRWLQEAYGVERIETLLEGTKSLNIYNYIHSGGAVRNILDAYSCFEGISGQHCGKCQACLRRYIALENNNIPEHIILQDYIAHPIKDYPDSPYVKNYNDKMITALETSDYISGYSYERCVETLSVINPEYLHSKGIKTFKESYYKKDDKSWMD